MSRSHRGLFIVGIALALSVIPFESVAASTGPYTYPFFDSVGRSRSYGCVSGTASAWTGVNADGTAYSCAAFHSGIDFKLGYDPVVASRAGTVIAVAETNPNNPGSACPAGSPPANFIMIDHGGGRYSRYLHLTTNGASVVVNDHVSAGQKIGTSGNSGFSCGAHLHYTLTNSATSVANSRTFDPDGKWTTSSGRVPWSTDFVSQLSGNAVLGAVDICYGETATYWVKFQNKGGRTWSTSNDADGNGRTVLYSTASSGTSAFASQFEASDWETSARVTAADQASVVPDGSGTFTFGLEGNGSPGQSYTVYFNLDAYNLHWFKYNDQVRVSIFIVPHQGCI